ncbi:small integral membrane protein 11-like isoform X2 [Osmerus eperlanus]|uniref:small integral membrane protein 11-like n=1 Tax=Osmerus mordax TaxID=8014 RepID=UPI002E0E7A79
MINWKALDNIPLLFYILAAKTILLCLGFAAVKIYQTNKLEAANKRELEEKKRLAQQTQELLDNKKDD